MVQVNGVSSTNLFGPPEKKNEPANELDKDAFLKLFVAQMQHQNPMSPQDNNEFISQVAQFSMVELLGKLEQAVDNLAGIQQAQQSASLLDRQVTVFNDEGMQITGQVEKVSLLGGDVKVTVNGKVYDVSQIIEIQGGSAIEQNQLAEPANTAEPTDTETQNTNK